MGNCLHSDIDPNIFLVGNEINKVEGLERLQELRELVLDRNKIKVTYL